MSMVKVFGQLTDVVGTDHLEIDVNSINELRTSLINKFPELLLSISTTDKSVKSKPEFGIL